MATNILALVVGDWSGDGHDKTEKITIQSNRTAAQLEAAYRKGSKKAGVDIVRDCCNAYECNWIPEDVIEKLKKAKIRSAEYFAEDTDFKDADTWAELYLDICKLGDAKLKVKILADHRKQINIGGYGLFFA